MTLYGEVNEVEQLTRQLDPRMAGTSDLSRTVADLVREARHSAA